MLARLHASALVLLAIATPCALPAAAPQQGPVREPRVLAADGSRGRIAMFDASGKVVWEAPTRQIHDLQYLDSGNVLFQTSWTELVEMTPDKKVVWSYDAATQNGNAGRAVEVHAFQRLANGVTMIAESGPSRIIEVDRGGALLREVPLTVAQPDPHRDTRLVRKLQNGNYLVAHEGEGAVREYAPDGKVVWDYAVPLFDRPRRDGHGPDAWGNQVYAAIRLANGNTLISTGNGHSVLEVTPDKEIVWHLAQNDLRGVRLAWVTTLEVLPNGNYLIGNCHAGPGQPQILEVTPSKKLVWSFENNEVLGNCVAASTRVDAHEDAAFYRDRVEPILAANCFKCHGTRDKKVRGELWLRTRHNVIEGGSSGPVIDPIDPRHSRILRYINHEDAEHQMPPKHKMSDAEIAVLTEWVERGVPMPVVENEWRYERPSLFTDDARAHWAFQPVVDPRLPAVAASPSDRSEIDRFVRARLQAAGLEPNGPADSISLLRRATHGLTGLPPSLDEVSAWMADPSDTAYESLIDRLLASPHYGEHWGRHWLDLVRYAETNGYERDSVKPEAWKYRQYVVDAFNRNKPYDRFVQEQLAGDELPDADAESITATGFLRLGLWDDEPADRKQAMWDGLDDIVRTSGETFLGLTIGCARCHDHKLDPIPQADYYRMVAFFRNIRPYSQNRQHILTDVATAEEKAAAEAENEKIRTSRAALIRRAHAIRDRFLQAYRADGGRDVQASDMTNLRFAFYRDTWDKLPDFDMLKPETVGSVPGDLFDTGLATRESEFGFVFRGELSVPRTGDYTFFLDSDDGARLSIDGAEVVLYDGIHGLGKERKKKIRLEQGLRAIGLEYFQRHGGRGLRVAWAGPDMPRRNLSRPLEETTGPGIDRLIARHGDRLLGAETKSAYDTLRRKIKALKDVSGARNVLSITERGPKSPATHVLIRGSAHAPADLVEPGFPQILGDAVPAISTRENSSGRRLALARWLTEPDNKLSARVIVNRVWQYHFGRGLVRSSSDFGMQGTAPTHPQLLDWLARRFVETGWDIKALHKRIMLSSTYRMSTRVNASALRRDPTNNLFWRFDMRRLTAEEIRDAILMVSGQLDLSSFGGPSVYPRIPKAVIAGQSRLTSWHLRDTVADNSRRTIYTFVKRSLVDPFVESFDGATTDTTCPVRFQTTQPTQALTLINSGFVNRAAAHLAERLIETAGDDRRAQITLALRAATCREPTPADIETGLEFLATFPDPTHPRQPLEQFCLIVLNLNAFLFVD